ncbi:sialidase [Ophiocordyceps sinensis CO18]|uniref:Sialidase n=1 Tax=Ophiocordyceps sinensis (strain Co18 / CGMCC 3.14243) TaxID=911162 RepID=T5AJT7_OPHSC|nr:sialidase [Ophiocordyceps sinensis CO18]
MSALEADVAFDFTFPYPCTPPPRSQRTLAIDSDDGPFFASFDSSFLDIPCFTRRHARSSSNASSVYSAVSTVESTPDSACTRLSTPPRPSPPVRHHGPLLLPKIRPQDQDVDRDHRPSSTSLRRTRNKSRVTPSPKPPSRTRNGSRHARSYTSPDCFAGLTPSLSTTSSPSPPLSSNYLSPPSTAHQRAASEAAPLLCSPAPFALTSDSRQIMPSDAWPSRRSSTGCAIDISMLDEYDFTAYRPPSSLIQSLPLASVTTTATPSTRADLTFSSYTPRAPSPLGLVAASTMMTTTLIDFLTGSNPAASLVRNISLPLRDPSIKHFWWDVRSIRSWNSFNVSAVLALPGASAMLTTRVPSPVLPQPSMSARLPETEASLHAIYASFYLPKLNAALAISSSRPLQLSVPAKTTHGVNDMLFVANADGDSATGAALFGGKPSARLVGLVRSFDRFNTGMRAEGNIKRVEYLRGLAALHHAMREHGCRYGFILTEIELVLFRCGTDSTPFFGDLEITSIQLAICSPHGGHGKTPETPLTACLALWGLCQLASDDSPVGYAHWRAEIGAPAAGTRRKARPRDGWMPQPQLAEKREAKRSRGWVWPEDPIGRKELGKRGVRYGAP